MTDNSFSDQSANYEYVVENFDIYEFLMEYKKRPELWDKNHQYYRNKLIRHESERSMCKKLQIPDLKTLRRKIRSVRGSYNAVIGKVRDSLQTSAQMYVTKLSWFPVADGFLRATTDIPVEIKIPMEVKLHNSVSEPGCIKKVPYYKSVAKPKTQYIVTDSRHLVKQVNMPTEEVLIEDGTYTYEELETTQEQDESTDGNKTGDDETTPNFKIESICNPEYEIAETDINENHDEATTMTEEFLELDSNSNQSEVYEANNGNNSTASKKQRKGRRYIVQNQIRNYRLDNSKPYDAKNRLLNRTEIVNTEQKETGMDNILNYLKDIASECENEFVAFGKSIGVQLSNMPKELAIQLQSDIQRHITKVRLNHLKESDDDAGSAE